MGEAQCKVQLLLRHRVNNGLEFTAGEGGTQLFAGLQLIARIIVYDKSFYYQLALGLRNICTAFVLSS